MNFLSRIRTDAEADAEEASCCPYDATAAAAAADAGSAAETEPPLLTLKQVS